MGSSSQENIPLVTVVIPVYNAEKYIAQTLQSVLDQDYPNLECLVLDDGSTDRTPEVLRRFANQAAMVRHPNRGEAGTVNRGVALAQGDIVGVVNADDPILPGLVSAAVERLRDRPELVAVYPDWLMIDQDGHTLREVRTPEYDYLIMLEQNYCFIGPGAFFRKSCLGDEPARDPRLRFASDFDLWMRLGLKGPMSRLPHTLATWRRHPQGASLAQRGQELADNKVELIRRFYEREGLPAPVLAARRQALSAAYYGAGLQGLYNPRIKARGYLLKSILLRPVWPGNFIPMQRRSWLRMAYIFFSPLSRWLHRALGGRGAEERL